ncbi:MAG TPA: NUDIX hydrolase [Polyangia bacterium]|nr:NUDIX hydrolase [Polyangia bacterium]
MDTRGKDDTEHVDDGAPAHPRVLTKGRYLTFIDESGWEYVTRPGVTGIVVIVAVTGARHLVLVEQYRRPVHKRVIELPAGLVGDIDGKQTESMADAAARELEEETGYRATEMVRLFEGPIAVGVSDEEVSFFEARGLARVGAGGGDDTEDITVHEVPLAELDAFLAAQSAKGLGIDPKIFAGLYLAGISR